MRRRSDPGPVDPPFSLAEAVAAQSAFLTCRKGAHEACRALIALVARLRRGVEARLRRLGATFHDAEDAVSDALLELYEAALAGTWRDAPHDWERVLFWKARTCLFQARRRMRIEQRHVSERARTKVDLASFDQEASEVEHLLRRLTPRERQVVMARASGHSYRAIAESGQTTAGAAKTHFANAKAKLRALDRRRNAA